jgi:hypothetical protein
LTATEALEHPWLKGTTASDTPLALTVLSNLSAFDGTCKFKTAILSMMTDSLGADEIKQLKVFSLPFVVSCHTHMRDNQ